MERQFKKWVNLIKELKKHDFVYFSIEHDQDIIDYLRASGAPTPAAVGDHITIEKPGINKVIKDIADQPEGSVVIDVKTATTPKFRQWVVAESKKYGMVVRWGEDGLIKISGNSVKVWG